MQITALDHLVLTVADIPVTCAFYRDVLGMQIETFGAGRVALKFGPQKINLHQSGNEISPHANHPAPGSADLCLLTETPIPDVINHLTKMGVTILDGPVPRTGANGPITSVYFRDPDLNLIEVSTYDAT